MKQYIEKLKIIIKNNYKWIILFGCTIGFLLLAEDVFNKEIIEGDIWGYKIISTFLISDFITPMVKVITNFGGALCLLIISLLLLVIIKDKKIGISIISNLGIITILNQLLKRIL